MSGSRYRVLFFGSDVFAVTLLDALYKHLRAEVVGVVTRADKPAGRGHVLTPPKAKEWALKRSIPVFQPTTLKKVNLETDLPAADVYVVCEYGRLIPDDMLDKPRLKTINVHPSLLPRYRGASPIQTALRFGDNETGVSIMILDTELDHGPLLAQEQIFIHREDTFVTLREKLSAIAERLLVTTLDAWADGKITPQPQNDDEATFCELIGKEDGRINFCDSAETIYNQYRAYLVWPGLFTTVHNRTVKITDLKPSPAITLNPGQVLYQDGKFFVGTGSHALEVLRIQPEGNRELSAREFMNGHAELNGSFLGTKAIVC